MLGSSAPSGKEVGVNLRFLAPSAILAAALMFATTAGAQQLLFRDTFNTADSASFDAAALDGRLSGSAAGTQTVLRSWGAQQQINNNQLLLPTGGDTGVRWENAAGPFGGANRYNWAGGTTGASILAAGGFSVSFDYAPPNKYLDGLDFVPGRHGQRRQWQSDQRRLRQHSDEG